MKNIIRLLCKLISIVLIITISACTPRLDDLFHSPCSAPCWYYVIPGKTTKDQLISQVSKFPYYQNQNTYWLDGSEQIPTTFRMYIKNIAELSINLSDNVVSSIGIYSTSSFFGFHDIGLDLKSAIDLYGKPSEMFIGSGCGGDTVCLNLNLIYSESGILVAVELAGMSSDFQVSPTLPVRKIIFFDPSSLNDILKNNLDIGSPDCILQKMIIGWQGYTTLQIDDAYFICR
jgi:hypothetical protein